MAKYGLIRSFGIDDGQLDGCTPQECFVLGYQLALFDEAMKSDDGFTQLLDCRNRERIEGVLEKSGRAYKVNYMGDDVSESWLNLIVFEKA